MNIEHHPISVEALSLEHMQQAQHTLLGYTGREGLELYLYAEAIKNGTELPPSIQHLSEDQIEDLKVTTDAHLSEHIMDRFNVSADQARHLIGDSFKGSNELMKRTLNNALPYEFNNMLGLRNEVSTFKSDIADHIIGLASNYRDSGERFQRLRRLLIAETFLQLYGTYPELQVNATLTDFQDFLNRHLFDSGDEATGLLEFTAFHDNETNEFKGLASEGIDCTNCHIKKHGMLTRELQNGASGIHVLTHARVKDYVSAVEKAWSKPANRKEKKELQGDYSPEFVLPIADVEDIAGTMVTVIGGVAERDYVVENMKAIFHTYGDGYIESVEDDDELDGRTDCKKIDWRRLKVKLKDVPYPIEIIVQDLEVGLNGAYCVVSEGDPRKPKAHLLFENIRSAQLLTHFYPPSENAAIYANNNIEQKVLEKRKAIIDELKTRNKVEDIGDLQLGYRFIPYNQAEHSADLMTALQLPE